MLNAITSGSDTSTWKRTGGRGLGKFPGPDEKARSLRYPSCLSGSGRGGGWWGRAQKGRGCFWLNSLSLQQLLPCLAGMRGRRAAPCPPLANLEHSHGLSQLAAEMSGHLCLGKRCQQARKKENKHVSTCNYRAWVCSLAQERGK